MMMVERQANPARFMRRLNLCEYDAARSSGSRNVRRSWLSILTTTFASSCTKAFAFMRSVQKRVPFAGSATCPSDRATLSYYELPIDRVKNSARKAPFGRLGKSLGQYLTSMADATSEYRTCFGLPNQ